MSLYEKQGPTCEGLPKMRLPEKAHTRHTGSSEDDSGWNVVVVAYLTTPNVNNDQQVT